MAEQPPAQQPQGGDKPQQPPAQQPQGGSQGGGNEKPAAQHQGKQAPKQPEGPGPQVKALTEHLRKSGTGANKLETIQRYQTAKQAIDHLRARGFAGTAKKAEAWLADQKPQK